MELPSSSRQQCALYLRAFLPHATMGSPPIRLAVIASHLTSGGGGTPAVERNGTRATMASAFADVPQARASAVAHRRLPELDSSASLSLA